MRYKLKSPVCFAHLHTSVLCIKLQMWSFCYCRAAVKVVVERLTFSTFITTTRSLMERDKPLYTLLIALEVIYTMVFIKMVQITESHIFAVSWGASHVLFLMLPSEIINALRIWTGHLFSRNDDVSNKYGRVGLYTSIWLWQVQMLLLLRVLVHVRIKAISWTSFLWCLHTFMPGW